MARENNVMGLNLGRINLETIKKYPESTLKFLYALAGEEDNLGNSNLEMEDVCRHIVPELDENTRELKIRVKMLPVAINGSYAPSKWILRGTKNNDGKGIPLYKYQCSICKKVHELPLSPSELEGEDGVKYLLELIGMGKDVYQRAGIASIPLVSCGDKGADYAVKLGIGVDGDFNQVPLTAIESYQHETSKLLYALMNKIFTLGKDALQGQYIMEGASIDEDPAILGVKEAYKQALPESRARAISSTQRRRRDTIEDMLENTHVGSARTNVNAVSTKTK